MGDLIVAPAARADLLAEWIYFADEVGRPDLGDRFVLCAERTFKNLARTPEVGRVRKFQSPKMKNVRSWQIEDFPKYLIFYRPLRPEHGVEVIRVLHGTRNLPAILGS